jgi:transcriptional regulator with XRE-family HTH domain
MYPNLKLQIFKTGIHQNRLARQLGLTDTVLSKIIHGYRQPTNEQRKLLAEYLRVDEEWLFERYDVSPVRKSAAVAISQEGEENGAS